MKKKNSIRLSFEFPREEYPYLKIFCAKKKISIGEFITNLLIKYIAENRN